MNAMDTFVDSSLEPRAQALGEHVVAASVGARDAARQWDPALFRRLGELGVLRQGLATARGRGRHAPLAEARHLAGFARGSQDAGLCAAIATHAHGCAAAIETFGGDVIRELYLSPLARGILVGALAHTESVRGAATERDGGIGTRATPLEGGRYRLDGTKPWVLNAPVADVFVVTAVLEGARATGAAEAFVLDRDTPGLRVGAAAEMFGLRTAQLSEIVLDGCVVSEARRLGARDHSSRVVRALALRETSLELAPWVGLMRALFDRCALHVNRSRAQGAPASAERVRAALADMWIHIEVATRTMQRAARQLVELGPTVDRDAASSTLLVANAFADVARSAVDLLRLQGVNDDPLVERLRRDAMVISQRASSRASTVSLRTAHGSIENRPA